MFFISRRGTEMQSTQSEILGAGALPQTPMPENHRLFPRAMSQLQKYSSALSASLRLCVR